MKKALSALVAVVGILSAAVVLAEMATKEECIEKAKEAARMVNEKGLDAAVAEINRKDGKFVWKSSYVFLMDFNGTMLAHPMRPEMTGRNMSNMKDARGMSYIREFINVAKDKGEGWVDYWMGSTSRASTKSSFIYRVPGKDLLVGAGR